MKTFMHHTRSRKQHTSDGSSISQSEYSHGINNKTETFTVRGEDSLSAPCVCVPVSRPQMSSRAMIRGLTPHLWM